MRLRPVHPEDVLDRLGDLPHERGQEGHVVGLLAEPGNSVVEGKLIIKEPRFLLAAILGLDLAVDADDGLDDLGGGDGACVELFQCLLQHLA